MNADEMFEKLGANKSETEDYITYRGKINKNVAFLFNKKLRIITLEGFNSITINDLQAINKKCQELGWLEQENGNFYKKNKIIECICGCKYVYEVQDIRTDTSLAYTTCPEQYKKYVECPECGAKTELGTTYKHGQTIKYPGI